VTGGFSASDARPSSPSETRLVHAGGEFFRFNKKKAIRKSMIATVGTYFEDLVESPDLGRLAKRSGVASVAGVYINGVLQIIGVVMLARLLTPEDFGLVAIVMALTRFAPLLIDFGTADATTQRTKITRGQSSTIFWLTSGIGCMVALGLVAFSPLIAYLYHEPNLKLIAICSGITYVFAGISAQHLALLRRTMQFGVIARMQIVSAILGLASAILIAVLGYGYWALVLRPIVSAACMAAGAWIACRWRPGYPVFDAEVKSMIGFGMHVLSASAPNSMMRVADRIAIGLVYTPSAVGFYQNAQNMYENAFLGPLDQLHNVGSAGLSKLQFNRTTLQEKYEATLSALAFFVMPAAAILSVTGQDIVIMLLGETWRVSGLLLSITALRGFVEFIEMSQSWLYVSSGRADRWKHTALISAIIRMLSILGGLPFGPVGVATALVAAGWLIALPSVSYSGRPLGIGADLVIRAVRGPFLGAIVALAAGWWLRPVLLGEFPALVRILLSILLSLSVYLLIVVGLFRITMPITMLIRLIRDFVARTT
jgi:O-antigen/teichoic acid export membrane protein